MHRLTPLDQTQSSVTWCNTVFQIQKLLKCTVVARQSKISKHVDDLLWSVKTTLTFMTNHPPSHQEHVTFHKNLRSDSLSNNKLVSVLPEESIEIQHFPHKNYTRIGHLEMFTYKMNTTKHSYWFVIFLCACQHCHWNQTSVTLPLIHH